jgi:hypothetical protein
MTENVFFHGGGFYAFCNYVGSIKRLYQEYTNPNGWLFNKEVHFYGNSAGATAALMCYMVFNDLITIDFFEQMMTGDNNILDKPIPPTLSLTPRCFAIVDYFLPHWPTDLHARITDKVFIGVTTETGHEFVSRFESNYYLGNALACSGTIVGLTTYDAKIDNRPCLDGEIRFSYNRLPRNTIILECPFWFPLCMTVPPIAIRQLVIDIGFSSVNKAMTAEAHTPLPELFDDKSIEWLFKIYKISYKNPMWNVHIMLQTQCPWPAPLQVKLFDLINYTYYTLLNHRN